MGIERLSEVEAGLVIVRVGRNLLPQLADVAALRCLARELDRTRDRLQLWLEPLGFRQPLQRLLRTLQVTEVDLAAQHARQGGRILLILLQDLREELCRLLGLAGSPNLLRLLENLFRRRTRLLTRHLQERRDELLHLALRYRALEPIDRLALIERSE